MLLVRPVLTWNKQLCCLPLHHSPRFLQPLTQRGTSKSSSHFSAFSSLGHACCKNAGLKSKVKQKVHLSYRFSWKQKTIYRHRETYLQLCKNTWWLPFPISNPLRSFPGQKAHSRKARWYAWAILFFLFASCFLCMTSQLTGHVMYHCLITNKMHNQLLVFTKGTISLSCCGYPLCHTFCGCVGSSFSLKCGTNEIESMINKSTVAQSVCHRVIVME